MPEKKRGKTAARRPPKDPVGKKVDGLGRRVGTVEKKIDALDRRVGTVDKKVDALDRRVNSVEKKVDSVDRKVDAVDRKVDAVDRKVDAVDRKIDTVVTGVFDRFSQTDRRIDGLEGKMAAGFDRVLSAIDAFAMKGETYDRKALSHGAILSAHEETLHGHERRLRTLEDR